VAGEAMAPGSWARALDIYQQLTGGFTHIIGIGLKRQTPNGRVQYELKTPWRNGTTHAIFEPLDFISALVFLVPQPRVK
jgi:hypothetical protein